MTWFQALDLIGTAVFAVTGAFRAVKHELDLLGVLVLAAFTGIGGGLLRDSLLGRLPPAALSSELHLILCLSMGLLVFFAAPRLATWWNWVKIGDAVGLGLFAALGSVQAFEAGLGPVASTLLGVLGAVGGGVIRDVLVRDLPSVLHAEIYATAAALGALLVWFLHWGTDWPSEWILLAGAGAGTFLRLLAWRLGWSLPRVRRLEAEPSLLARKKARRTQSEEK